MVVAIQYTSAYIQEWHIPFITYYMKYSTVIWLNRWSNRNPNPNPNDNPNPNPSPNPSPNPKSLVLTLNPNPKF